MENLLMHMYRQITEKQVDTWDIQWSYCVNRGGGLCVTPLQNLVRNTGIQGSHFSYRTPFHNMRIQPFPLHRLTDLPSNHPPLSIQHEIEAMAFNNILHRPLSLPLRILRKIEMLFR